MAVLPVTGACWVWATVALIVAARQVTPEWVQTRSLSLFYVVLQGPFVLGGLGFGVIDTFLSLRDTLLIAVVAFVPGILLIPRFGLPVVDRSSLQLVASPSLSIGEHVRPDDGPVLVLVEYRIAPGDVETEARAFAFHREPGEPKFPVSSTPTRWKPLMPGLPGDGKCGAY